MKNIKSIYDKNLKDLNIKTKNVFTLVNSEGDDAADFLVLLSAPTAYEEVAGIELDKNLKKEIEKIISSTGWDKNSLYYTYAIKSCPYEFDKRGKIQYRDANELDMNLFKEFLFEEINFVSPKVIFAIGNIAFKGISDKDLSSNFDEKIIFDGKTLVLAYSSYADLLSNDISTINKIKSFIFKAYGESAPAPVLEKLDISFDNLEKNIKKEDYDLVDIQNYGDSKEEQSSTLDEKTNENIILNVVDKESEDISLKVCDEDVELKREYDVGEEDLNNNMDEELDIDRINNSEDREIKIVSEEEVAVTGLLDEENIESSDKFNEDEKSLLQTNEKELNEKELNEKELVDNDFEDEDEKEEKNEFERTYDEITKEELQILEDELNKLAAEKNIVNFTNKDESILENDFDSSDETYTSADKRLIEDVKNVNMQDENHSGLYESGSKDEIVTKIKSVVKQVDTNVEILEEDSELKFTTWEDFDTENNDLKNRSFILLLYAGSGLKNDASKSVLDTVANVFDDLNTKIKMMNIYDENFDLDCLLDDLNKARGLVLASSVEWYGIGYKLQKLLDDIYYSGRSNIMHNIPVMIISISRNAYEDVSANYIQNSLEILGAIPIVRLLGTIESSVYYDTNRGYKEVVERHAEDFYRQLSKGVKTLPSSLNNRKVFIKIEKKVDKDTENSSIKHDENITYNEFLETQKKDIDELSEIFDEKVSLTSKGDRYSEFFENAFIGSENLENSIIAFDIGDNAKESFNAILDKKTLDIIEFDNNNCNVIITLTQGVMNDIVKKNTTMQKAFLTGAVKVKGNFDLLYKIDSMFEF